MIIKLKDIIFQSIKKQQMSIEFIPQKELVFKRTLAGYFESTVQIKNNSKASTYAFEIKGTKHELCFCFPQKLSLGPGQKLTILLRVTKPYENYVQRSTFSQQQYHIRCSRIKNTNSSPQYIGVKEYCIRAETTDHKVRQSLRQSIKTTQIKHLYNSKPQIASHKTQNDNYDLFRMRSQSVKNLYTSDHLYEEYFRNQPVTKNIETEREMTLNQSCLLFRKKGTQYQELNTSNFILDHAFIEQKEQSMINSLSQDFSVLNINGEQKCTSKNTALYICTEQKCLYKGPFICSSSICNCFKTHRGCNRIQAKIFLEQINKIKINIQKEEKQLENKIYDFYDALIDSLSEERDKIAARIKSGKANKVFDYSQKLINLIKEGQSFNWEQKNGRIIAETIQLKNQHKYAKNHLPQIIKQLKNNTQNFKQGDLKAYSNQLFDTLFTQPEQPNQNIKSQKNEPKYPQQKNQLKQPQKPNFYDASMMMNLTGELEYRILLMKDPKEMKSQLHLDHKKKQLQDLSFYKSFLPYFKKLKHYQYFPQYIVTDSQQLQIYNVLEASFYGSYNMPLEKLAKNKFAKEITDEFFRNFNTKTGHLHTGIKLQSSKNKQYLALLRQFTIEKSMFLAFKFFTRYLNVQDQQWQRYHNGKSLDDLFQSKFEGSGDNKWVISLFLQIVAKIIRYATQNQSVIKNLLVQFTRVALIKIWLLQDFKLYIAYEDLQILLTENMKRQFKFMKYATKKQIEEAMPMQFQFESSLPLLELRQRYWQLPQIEKLKYQNRIRLPMIFDHNPIDEYHQNNRPDDAFNSWIKVLPSLESQFLVYQILENKVDLFIRHKRTGNVTQGPCIYSNLYKKRDFFAQYEFANYVQFKECLGRRQLNIRTQNLQFIVKKKLRHTVMTH